MVGREHLHTAPHRPVVQGVGRRRVEQGQRDSGGIQLAADAGGQHVGAVRGDDLPVQHRVEHPPQARSGALNTAVAVDVGHDVETAGQRRDQDVERGDLPYPRQSAGEVGGADRATSDQRQSGGPGLGDHDSVADSIVADSIVGPVTKQPRPAGTVAQRSRGALGDRADGPGQVTGIGQGEKPRCSGRGKSCHALSACFFAPEIRMTGCGRGHRRQSLSRKMSAPRVPARRWWQ